MVKCVEMLGEGKEKTECGQTMRPIDVDREKKEVIYYCDACEGSRIVKEENIVILEYPFCIKCLELGERGVLKVDIVDQLVQGYDHYQTAVATCLACGVEQLVESTIRPKYTYRDRSYCKWKATG